ncbi:MAG: tetratricopeptide repeat protein [Steroidobacteraceae bacterium]
MRPPSGNKPHLKASINSAAVQVPSKIQQAIALHQQGDLGRAQRIYEDVLKIQPRNFDALHLLGVIAGQTKNFEKSVELISKALVIDPQNAAAYSNRGAALRELRQFEAALASYNQAIAIKADNAVAHYNCGNVLKELKQLDAALASYEQAIAIKPNYAEAHYNRGHVLQELKRYDSALTSYNQAVAIRPNYVEAYYNRGLVLQELKQPESALKSYDQAIAIKPDYAEAYANRGIALKELRQYEAALASHNQAIALKADCVEAYSNRGVVLGDLGKFEAALASYDRAIAIKPEYAQAYTNRGIALKELEQFEAALASHNQAIAIEPDCAEAYANRGVLHYELQQLDEALDSYNRAIAINADFVQAYENRAHALLLDGKLESGWTDNEWRWKNENGSRYLHARNFPQPLWLGEESLAGKTILLHGEQGLGDRIQFSRYAKLVSNLGATVILEVEAQLRGLLESLEGVAHVVERGDALPDFDYQCPLLSLPLAFKTTLSTIPADVPYLKSSPDKVLYWREKLGDKRNLRVGLVWSGGFRPNQPELSSVNRRRNIPLSKLASLRHPDIEFYSLQKGQPAELELTELMASNWDGPRLIDFTGQLHDFSDTAALIEQLDLVISVDTSTAHLAGALGKPVWILNRFDGCWRWLLDRTDSPWYPTATLYRQQITGDWDGVVERVRVDLMELAARGLEPRVQ